MARAKSKSQGPKILAFSVTKDQFRWEYFPAGGPGGQHQNKVSTACRVTHEPSGAVGVSRVHRSQLQNREEALRSLARSPEFEKWSEIEAARRQGKELGCFERREPTERVRTYDLCDKRVTDHGTGIKTSDVDGVLDGQLDQFIEPKLLAQAENVHS